MNEAFTKPWHGIEREEISWQPTVEEELCIGCGMCVTGCGRMVYRFDYETRKPVVTTPIHCMVGCITCANTCPQHAISFPPLSYVHRLIKERHLLKEAKATLDANRGKYSQEGQTLP